MSFAVDNGMVSGYHDGGATIFPDTNIFNTSLFVLIVAEKYYLSISITIK